MAVQVQKRKSHLEVCEDFSIDLFDLRSNLKWIFKADIVVQWLEAIWKVVKLK